MDSKKCSKCHTSKPLDEFYNDLGTGDGKTTHCKECRKQAANDYRTRKRAASPSPSLGNSASFSIYLLESKLSWYVGSAFNRSTPQSRLVRHKKGTGGARLLKEAMESGELFSLAILETSFGLRRDACSVEEQWIHKFLSQDARQCLNSNLYPSQSAGWGWTDEMRQTASERLLGKPRPDVSAALRGKEPWNKGKIGIYSEETLAKMSAATTIQMLDENTRQRLSDNAQQSYVMGLRLKYKCAECKMVSYAGPLGHHQSRTGHQGRELA